MKEEFTEEEKWQAKRLVSQIADGGKYDKEMRALHEKLNAMVDENTEENAFFCVVHNDTLGMTTVSVGGLGISIVTALVHACEKDKETKALFMEAAAFMAQRDLKEKFGIKDE